MRRPLLLAALVPAAGALLAGCAGLLGVEPLSGDDAGENTGTDAPAESGPLDAGALECGAVWVDASGGFVPPGAVNAEPVDAQTVTIYVCRASAGSDVIPGKLRPDYGCYYGGPDAEVLTLDYQVLVPAACTVGWAAAPDGVTPAYAVPCGSDSQGDLYSCRVTQPAG